jgi:hypothetical protein
MVEETDPTVQCRPFYKMFRLVFGCWHQVVSDLHTARPFPDTFSIITRFVSVSTVKLKRIVH